ncbi:nitroreductase/quinone reductase family protein [Pengzhenrongella frigida]|uniref:MBL fold metallo-hydrolase n=1 Tax=Pengzhenrongella frigida TaxID=1259133 RepID=A0A4V1ZHI3_9MICO|nr:nitroreductase/quinone reductase family protein [Cellulomonas sp. HLT2-17]RYV52144.1 MBL fold metallo-hydrolase [Cellulomonas sp. HLT2-17]
MRAQHPREIAPGVYLALGRGLTKTNVYLVRSGSSCVLVDAAWPGSAAAIRAAVESVCGRGARPSAIVLTHLHPDHAGSARELAHDWAVPVYVHPDELPMAGPDYPMEYANPVDRRLSAVLLRVLPARSRARLRARNDLTGVVQALDSQGVVPGLPEWSSVPTPGHTPGHVALHRPGDGVLLTGDAVLTVNANSVWDLVRGQQRLAGPPRYFTWSWAGVTESVATLAALEPRVLATGHGTPLSGAGTAEALRSLAAELAGGSSRATWPHVDWRTKTGLFKAVDYTARVSYRPPPAVYRRVQRWAPIVTRLGVSPDYVVTLEVPGRRSGVIRRTSLVQVAQGSARYLVALAGESEWVRNVRAARGRVVLGRRERRIATLVEVPPEERAPIIRAYLLRAGRRPGSTAVANEARGYFGVSADPRLDEIRPIVERYPVFRVEDGRDPGPA